MPKLGEEDDNEVSTDEMVEAPEGDQAPSEQVAQVVEDERLSAQADEVDEDEDSEEPRKERHRETAKERRQRVKNAKENDKLEIRILRTTTAKQDARLKELEDQLTVTRVTDLDTRMATAINESNQFDEIFGKAISNKAGEDARKAAEFRDAAKQRAWSLYNEKQAILGQAQQRANVKDVPYAEKAKEFLQDKQWYNPGSGDEDSLVVEALDKALMHNMNPNDPNYWKTLDAKVREKLPHKFSDDQSDDQDEAQDPAPARRKGPPVGGSNRNISNRGPQEIRLPAEMVAVMKESGNWDDPKKRARVAQRYIDGIKQSRG